MPLRNILIIAITAIVSVACYSVAARNRYANVFAEVLNVVEQRALQSSTREELFNSAMDGMLSKLDRHSLYLRGDKYEEFNTAIDQQFGGLGVFIGRGDNGDQLLVRAAFPGSPADRAGLEPGDEVLEIDGKPLADFEPGQALRSIKGDVGTSVNLTIGRNEKTLKVTVDREQIHIPSVRGDRWLPDGDWKYTLESDSSLGYIRIVSFSDRTTEEFHAALERLAGNVEGLIIDLRGNAGGLLSCAVDLCDALLPDDLEIVRIETRKRRLLKRSYRSQTKPMLPPEIPVVVLVDRYSASASEIMAGCLQDHGRAIVLGEQTWGKGTVQDVLPIERGESALKLTTSSYWRPSGRNIDRDFAAENGDDFWGVQPDEGYEIELSESEVQRNEFFRGEHELRELTGGMEFPSPKLYVPPADDSDEQDDADVKTASEDSPADEESLETETTFDESWSDEPLQRAIEHLKMTPAKEVTPSVAA